MPLQKVITTSSIHYFLAPAHRDRLLINEQLTYQLAPESTPRAHPTQTHALSSHHLRSLCSPTHPRSPPGSDRAAPGHAPLRRIDFRSLPRSRVHAPSPRAPLPCGKCVALSSSSVILITRTRVTARLRSTCRLCRQGPQSRRVGHSRRARAERRIDFAAPDRKVESSIPTKRLSERLSAALQQESSRHASFARNTPRQDRAADLQRVGGTS